MSAPAGITCARTAPADETALVIADVATVRLGSPYREPRAVSRCDREHHHLLWAMGARAHLRLDDRRIVLHPTAVAWIPMGVQYLANAQADLGTLRVLPTAATAAWSRPVDLPVDPVVVPSLSFVAGGLHRPGAAELLAVATDQIRNALRRPLPALPLPIDPGARLVADRLLIDPSDQRDVQAWAVVARCSPRTLRRRFDDETGLPFAQWRQRARLRHAMDLLARGETVDATARRSGFRSRTAFARSFKVETGMTPSQFTARPTDAHSWRPREQPNWPLVRHAAEQPSPVAPPIGAEGGIDMLTTRRLATVAVATGLLAVACGSDDDASEDTRSSGTETRLAPATDETDADPVVDRTDATFPRTITDPAGNKVTISAAPERVVVVGDRSELDYLLTLGVVPVQVSTNRFLEDTPVFDGNSIMPFQQEVLDTSDTQVAKVPGVGTDPTDPEDILPADPDLIIGFEYQVGDAREEREQIAPVFTYEFGPWQDNVRSLGEALGLEDRAEQVIAGWDQRLADAFADGDVPTGTTYAFVDAYPPESALYISPDPAYGPNVLFEAAGFTRLDSYDEIDGFSISYERVDLLNDADVIVFVNYDADSTLAQQFIDDPIGQSIPAVERGDYLILQQGEAAQAMDRLAPISLDAAAAPVIAAAELATDG